MDTSNILISATALIVGYYVFEKLKSRSKHYAPVVKSSSIPLLGTLITLADYGKDPIDFVKRAHLKVTNSSNYLILFLYVIVWKSFYH